ncbi:hypothetical protein PsorP6_003702 [Peronosclerospora sorghi]|uniref:Uncharacterized protein n=1 Tax=Peronosclerospora sorghi TaxID=230839 RepID=A0ACC0VNN8_9STRA|nr:hypothetical protein PsorP6_003702 [Peronosclerospora sorghi]
MNLYVRYAFHRKQNIVTRRSNERTRRNVELGSRVRFYRMVHFIPDFFCGFWVGCGRSTRAGRSAFLISRTTW